MAVDPVYYVWPADDVVMRGFSLAFGIIAAILFFFAGHLSSENANFASIFAPAAKF